MFLKVSQIWFTVELGNVKRIWTLHAILFIVESTLDLLKFFIDGKRYLYFIYLQTNKSTEEMHGPSLKLDVKFLVQGRNPDEVFNRA